MRSSTSEADTTPIQASSAQSSSKASNSDRPEESFPDASRLTSLPAPSTNLIQEPTSVELTPSAPMSEDAPASQADPGPAQIDSGEVSETPAHPDEAGVSETPPLVGSGGPSNANPQETELSSTKIPSIPEPAVEISGHADPSE